MCYISSVLAKYARAASLSGIALDQKRFLSSVSAVQFATELNSSEKQVCHVMQTFRQAANLVCWDALHPGRLSPGHHHHRYLQGRARAAGSARMRNEYIDSRATGNPGIHLRNGQILFQHIREPQSRGGTARVALFVPVITRLTKKHSQGG